jgi:hypothetical protein
MLGLPVDAAGVDLQQDRDAMGGPEDDLSRRDPGVQPWRDCGVPQVVGPAASGYGAALR